MYTFQHGTLATVSFCPNMAQSSQFQAGMLNALATKSLCQKYANTLREITHLGITSRMCHDDAVGFSCFVLQVFHVLFFSLKVTSYMYLVVNTSYLAGYLWAAKSKKGLTFFFFFNHVANCQIFPSGTLRS
jgi:hypothetical protein